MNKEPITAPDIYELVESLVRFAATTPKNSRRRAELIDIINGNHSGHGKKPDEPVPPRFLIRQNTEKRWSLMERTWGTFDGKPEWMYNYPFPAAENCESREHCEAWVRRIANGCFDEDRRGFPRPLYDGARIYLDEEGREIDREEVAA